MITIPLSQRINILLVGIFHMRLSDFTVARCATIIDVTVANIKLHSVCVSVHHENSCCKERTIVFHQEVSDPAKRKHIFSNAMKHFNSFSAILSFVACIETAYNCHYLFFSILSVFRLHRTVNSISLVILLKRRKSKILEDILIFRCMQNFTITINNNQKDWQ